MRFPLRFTIGDLIEMATLSSALQSEGFPAVVVASVVGRSRWAELLKQVGPSRGRRDRRRNLAQRGAGWTA
jgi:hypothetical protein